MAACNDGFADSEGVLGEEIAVLESIYITELTVEQDARGVPTSVSVLLHPSTGMDNSKKYVCMTLCFRFPPQYPDKAPEITVRNPRGLGEEELQSLIEDMKKRAEQRQGSTMLFELIEMAKDCLTEGNVPHCECAICLENFREGDNFVKTDCYHYFHRHCLARYANTFVAKLEKEAQDHTPAHVVRKETEKSLDCPMCRLPLSLDLVALLDEIIPAEETFDFIPTVEIQQRQDEMEALFQQQKAKGGIIDLDQERNKFFVDENTVVYLDRPGKIPDLEPSKDKDHRSNRYPSAATNGLDSQPSSSHADSKDGNDVFTNTERRPYSGGGEYRGHRGRGGNHNRQTRSDQGGQNHREYRGGRGRRTCDDRGGHGRRTNNERGGSFNDRGGLDLQTGDYEKDLHDSQPHEGKERQDRFQKNDKSCNDCTPSSIDGKRGGHLGTRGGSRGNSQYYDRQEDYRNRQDTCRDNLRDWNCDRDICDGPRNQVWDRYTRGSHKNGLRGQDPDGSRYNKRRDNDHLTADGNIDSVHDGRDSRRHTVSPRTGHIPIPNYSRDEQQDFRERRDKRDLTASVKGIDSRGVGQRRAEYKRDINRDNHNSRKPIKGDQREGAASLRHNEKVFHADRRHSLKDQVNGDSQDQILCKKNDFPENLVNGKDNSNVNQQGNENDKHEDCTGSFDEGVKGEKPKPQNSINNQRHGQYIPRYHKDRHRQADNYQNEVDCSIPGRSSGKGRKEINIENMSTNHVRSKSKEEASSTNHFIYDKTGFKTQLSATQPHLDHHAAGRHTYNPIDSHDNDREERKFSNSRRYSDQRRQRGEGRGGGRGRYEGDKRPLANEARGRLDQKLEIDNHLARKSEQRRETASRTGHKGVSANPEAHHPTSLDSGQNEDSVSKRVPPGFKVSGPPPGFNLAPSIDSLNMNGKNKPPPGFENI